MVSIRPVKTACQWAKTALCAIWAMPVAISCASGGKKPRLCRQKRGIILQTQVCVGSLANANLSGRSPSILLSQDRSVAQTSHWDVCCLRKRELVGSQPLHLAIARPFCRLKAPLGLSLLHFVLQTRTCRSETPPFCLRKNVLSLKHPAGVFVASANAKLFIKPF